MCGTLSLNDPEYSENDLQTQNGSNEEAHSKSNDSDIVIIDDEKENEGERRCCHGKSLSVQTTTNQS